MRLGFQNQLIFQMPRQRLTTSDTNYILILIQAVSFNCSFWWLVYNMHFQMTGEVLACSLGSLARVFHFFSFINNKEEYGIAYGICILIKKLTTQVLNQQGYDGSAADVWSCGVILYVLMAGYLPFNETNLQTLYEKVCLSCHPDL